MGFVPVKYYQSFGKCDTSEPQDWEVELTDEEQKIYDAEMKRIKEAIVKDNPELSIDEVEISDEDMEFYEFDDTKLSDALERAEMEIAEQEATEYDNEECQNDSPISVYFVAGDVENDENTDEYNEYGDEDEQW